MVLGTQTFGKGSIQTIIELDDGSALTDPALAVPKHEDPTTRQGVPITYVPARNTVFLALALAHAEAIGASVPRPQHLQGDFSDLLAVDAVEAAKSGHPGLPMGAADYAFLLWQLDRLPDPAGP